MYHDSRSRILARFQVLLEKKYPFRIIGCLARAFIFATRLFALYRETETLARGACTSLILCTEKFAGNERTSQRMAKKTRFSFFYRCARKNGRSAMWSASKFCSRATAKYRRIHRIYEIFAASRLFYIFTARKSRSLSRNTYYFSKQRWYDTTVMRVNIWFANYRIIM